MTDLQRSDETGVHMGAPLTAFIDEATGLRIEAYDPAASPEVWADYVACGEARYRKKGLTHVFGRDVLGDGADVSLLYVARDLDGSVVGGVRCHGPLTSSNDAYALRELAGHRRLVDLRYRIDSVLVAGLVELKGAWVKPGQRYRGLSDVWARCHVHALDFFNAKYAISTASDLVAPTWATSGGMILADIDPVAYPDERYRTVVIWWASTRLEDRATATQWRRITDERAQISGDRPTPTAAAGDDWKAEILDEREPLDAVRLAQLCANPTIEVLDRLDEQLDGLARMRPVFEVGDGDEPRWVFYPWRRTVVRVLGPVSFRMLRLDRNRNKITLAEQERLAAQRIGVVGLSVGHTIAYTLALEGICGELRLADFDTIELSNLNRIPVTVLDLGCSKAVAVARRIAELDPYLSIELVPEGLTAGNADAFVEGLDVLVEECDSLDVKALVRDAARRHGVPVLMETSDRGLLDVERFDLEPERPIFHGLLGDVEPADLIGLSTQAKVPHVLRILEPEHLSSRMAASMAEIDQTLTTWPQLGGDVALGGATIAAAVRRLGRGLPLASGRIRVDLDVFLDDLDEPSRPAVVAGEPITEPVVPGADTIAVAHAANLAPSGGNSQPWGLDVDDRRLRITLDRSRTSAMDVAYRGSYVAIGAALHNARVAAAARGVLGGSVAFPDGEASDLVAELSFAVGDDETLAAAYPHVLDRRTNRRAGRPAPLPEDLIGRLHREVALEGAQMHLLTGSGDIADYAELLAESDRLRYLTPQLHTEMMSELRWPGDPDPHTGIDVRTLDLEGADLAKFAVARRADVMAELAAWDGGRALGDITRERVRASSALAFVTVGDSRPSSYVAGGSAVQRLWLAATAAGLGVQPVSPVSVFAVSAIDYLGLVPGCYVERLQALQVRIRKLAGVVAGEELALVVRLSHDAGTAVRSLRIPLETALRR